MALHLVDLEVDSVARPVDTVLEAVLDKVQAVTAPEAAVAATVLEAAVVATVLAVDLVVPRHRAVANNMPAMVDTVIKQFFNSFERCIY